VKKIPRLIENHVASEGLAVGAKSAAVFTLEQRWLIIGNFTVRAIPEPRVSQLRCRRSLRGASLNDRHDPAQTLLTYGWCSPFRTKAEIATTLDNRTIPSLSYALLLRLDLSTCIGERPDKYP
jgi:hypothetical protein